MLACKRSVKHIVNNLIFVDVLCLLEIFLFWLIMTSDVVTQTVEFPSGDAHMQTIGEAGGGHQNFCSGGYPEKLNMVLKDEICQKIAQFQWSRTICFWKLLCKGKVHSWVLYLLAGKATEHDETSSSEEAEDDCAEVYTAGTVVLLLFCIQNYLWNRDRLNLTKLFLCSWNCRWKRQNFVGRVRICCTKFDKQWLLWWFIWSGWGLVEMW